MTDKMRKLLYNPYHPFLLDLHPQLHQLLLTHLFRGPCCSKKIGWNRDGDVLDVISNLRWWNRVSEQFPRRLSRTLLQTLNLSWKKWLKEVARWTAGESKFSYIAHNSFTNQPPTAVFNILRIRVKPVYVANIRRLAWSLSANKNIKFDNVGFISCHKLVRFKRLVNPLLFSKK